MENHFDFKKICRACLSDTAPMKDLFIVCSPEVFKYCTSIEISDSDKLPRQLCQLCLDLMDKLYHFKQVVLRSNAVLRQFVQAKEKVKAESVGIDNDSNETSIKEYTEELPCNLNLQEINTINDDNILERHQLHKQIYPGIRKKRRKRGEPLILKKRIRMKCPKCDKSFQKYENFEAHLRSHFGKKPDIKCDHCEKTFPTLRNLHSHIRTHTGVRKYQCLTCGKNFAYLNVLKNHELIHLGVKKHVCHICDAKFVQRYNLKTHLETHTNQKNYICGQCGKKFAQSGNLKVHLIRHTGIKNIACQLCDMRFYVKSDLFKHMRSHSEDKPFSCEFCDKTFKSKSFQVVHLRTHTGERPYACDLCPKKFMARKDMRNHRMIHTGEKPHKCLLCNQAFIQKCALNRHMKSHGTGKGKNDDHSILITEHLQRNVNNSSITMSYTQWDEA